MQATRSEEQHYGNMGCGVFKGGIKSTQYTAFCASFLYCTEVRFASFLSGRFITMAAINSPEKKLAKRTSVQYKKLAQNALRFKF